MTCTGVYTLTQGDIDAGQVFNTGWAASAETEPVTNIVEPVLKHDTQLRQSLRQDLGGLPPVPEQESTSTSLAVWKAYFSPSSTSLIVLRNSAVR